MTQKQPLPEPRLDVPETPVWTVTPLPGQLGLFGDDQNPEPAADISPAKQHEGNKPTE